MRKMSNETIQKCIDLLNTDGINSKEQVKKILQGELDTKDNAYKPKDVMFSCFIPDVEEFTPKMREYCLQKIGRRIVEDSLQNLEFRVRQLNLHDQLPPDIKGIKVQARVKYVILED